MKTISVVSLLIGGGLTSSCTSNLPDPDDQGSLTTAEAEDATDNVKPKVTSNFLATIIELPIERVFELQQTDSILLIDTRAPIFYRLGHIDGAYSLPLKSFEKSFYVSKSILDSAETGGKKIVIYCQSEKCTDSYIMARALSESGYKVSVFKGG